MKTISGRAVNRGLAVAVLAVFTVWITSPGQIAGRGYINNRGSALTGKAAPALTLPALDGQDVSLADYRGRTW